jgi:hypothetical protein
MLKIIKRLPFFLMMKVISYTRYAKYKKIQDSTDNSKT